MAKKGSIQREQKRQMLVERYIRFRTQHKDACKKRSSLKEYLQIHQELQKLPRNSSPTRLHNRCQLSGRSRGYYRRFGMSRHFLRELAYDGSLPGVTKSSW